MPFQCLNPTLHMDYGNGGERCKYLVVMDFQKKKRGKQMWLIRHRNIQQLYQKFFFSDIIEP